MLIVIDDRAVMRRFSRLLIPQKVYRIRDFLVRLNHDPSVEKYHLNLAHASVVERHDADMPEHCWDIVTVPHVIHGLVVGDGLIGTSCLVPPWCCYLLGPPWCCFFTSN